MAQAGAKFTIVPVHAQVPADHATGAAVLLLQEADVRARQGVPAVHPVRHGLRQVPGEELDAKLDGVRLPPPQ